MKYVAITSCPTGIAHTYMAAEALEQAARARGDEISVETQGSAGSQPVDPAVIAGADAVIVAADAAVQGRERFAGLPTVEVNVGEAINHPGDVLERAAAAAGGGVRTVTPAGLPHHDVAAPGTSGKGGAIRRWLMTGVSYMIPFVTAGGILIALAFAFGGALEVVESDVYERWTWAGMLFEIGSTAFSMLVPVLAGFIAYAMADRPGIAPGVVGGLIANEVGAGFLGGIAAGLAAGLVVMALKQLKVPRSFAGLMPVLVYPLIATFAVGALMILVVGEPIADLTDQISDWLQGLQGTNAVLLGLVLGLMMAFDMGGPVNKVAYTFAVGLLASGVQGPMAAVMAAGMTPPLGLALATRLRRGIWTESEREAGNAAWLLGASFITEGAIPFAAADPLRVIPSIMAGSAVAGALSLGFGATLNAPHGGAFVVGLVGNILPYALAIAAGTVVTAVAVTLAKSMHGRRQASSPPPPPIAAPATAGAR